MKPEVMLLDIEGTTTSISFVYDTLFPYARAHMDAHVRNTWDTKATQAAASLVLERARAEGPVHDDEPVPVSVAAAKEWVILEWLRMMDADMKETSLKKIQGDIWRTGYTHNQLQAHLFEDVRPAMERWREEGRRIAIYSSGSVAAQKLLFAYSVKGDLSGLIEAYFDTTTGSKKESASYSAIAEALRVEPGQILFLTDNLAEADAAHHAGVPVKVSVRPGNPDLSTHSFDEIYGFEGI